MDDEFTSVTFCTCYYQRQRLECTITHHQITCYPFQINNTNAIKNNIIRILQKKLKHFPPVLEVFWFPEDSLDVSNGI